MPAGPRPTGIVAVTALRARVDLRDSVVGAVRDPDRIGAHCHGGRIDADADLLEDIAGTGIEDHDLARWRRDDPDAPEPDGDGRSTDDCGRVSRYRPVTGSIRDTVPSEELVTQTAFSPDATPLGPLPTRDRLRHPVRLSIDPRDGAVEAVRDPDGVLGDGEARGAAADRDRLPDVVRPRIDARHGVTAGIRHPDRIRTPGDPAGGNPTGIWAATLPLSGSITPTAFAADRGARRSTRRHA